MLNQRWRILRYETHPARMNMAIDEAIAEMLSYNEASPTIRFYGWNPSAVSIGCFQNLEDEVDVQRCEELGIDIVRRRTGGGAVFHDKDGEITYSVICPEAMMDKDINPAYRRSAAWIVKGLKMVGITAEFRPINDITVTARRYPDRPRPGVPACSPSTGRCFTASTRR